jgi:thiol-disulfide isomerase/thioredoxin
MTTTAPTPPQKPALSRRIIVLGGAVLAVVLGLGVLYGTNRGLGNGAPAECQAAKSISAAMTPLARGEVAAVKVYSAPKPLPELPFADPDGKPVSVADFKGKTLVFNLWATWCVPCRTEMPALDKLQAQLGGSDFQVVAVNIDTRNPDKPRQWLTENGIRQLAYYSDPAAKTFQELKLAGKAIGMPTTLIIDRNGCELANIAGPAEWASEDALKLIRAAMGKG